MSVRAFSSALDVSEATTRNYLDRGTKPSSDYLEKVVRHFSRVNPLWLLTGEGTMMMASTSEPNGVHQKISGGNNVGYNATGGRVTQTQSHIPASQSTETWGKESMQQFYEKQLEAAQREIELLKGQLGDKERIIKLLERQINNTPT